MEQPCVRLCVSVLTKDWLGCELSSQDNLSTITEVLDNVSSGEQHVDSMSVC